MSILLTYLQPVSLWQGWIVCGDALYQSAMDTRLDWTIGTSPSLLHWTQMDS